MKPVGNFLQKSITSLLQGQQQKTSHENEDEPTSPISFVQNLWAGYGQILRVKNFDLGENNTNNNKNADLIIKIINCPCSDISSNASHQRKLKSYCVEIDFYQKVIPLLLSTAKSNSSFVLPFAKCFECGDLPNTCQKEEDSNTNSTIQKYLALQDLASVGYDIPVSRFCDPMPKSAITSVLTWLARFHSLTARIPGLFDDDENSSHFVFFRTEEEAKTIIESVWPQGSYWHFGTRQEEWEKMIKKLKEEESLSSSSAKNSGFKFLTEQAKTIDEILFDSKNSSSSFSSLVHGDPKFENFCFSSSSCSSSPSDNRRQRNDNDNAKEEQNPTFSSCAAVDFQYVGFGNPIVDVAVFAGYAIDENVHHNKKKNRNGQIEKQVSDFVQEYRSLLLQSFSDLLKVSLQNNGDDEKLKETIMLKITKIVDEQCISLFPVAVADYSRFYLGWSKGMTFDLLPEWQQKMCFEAERIILEKSKK